MRKRRRRRRKRRRKRSFLQPKLLTTYSGRPRDSREPHRVWASPILATRLRQGRFPNLQMSESKQIALRLHCKVVRTTNIYYQTPSLSHSHMTFQHKLTAKAVQAMPTVATASSCPIVARACLGQESPSADAVEKATSELLCTSWWCTAELVSAN